MFTIIAYVLVVFLATWCLTAGAFLVGFPVALLLAWAPITLRVKVSGVIGHVAGVLFAVAFGYGVFRLVVGPNSFTVGAFLASTVPLLIAIWNDFLHAQRVTAAAQKVQEAFPEANGESLVEVTAMAAGSRIAVVGEIIGLVLVTAWFFNR